MDVNLVQYLISIFAFCLYFYLLYVGYRDGLIRHFPFFYGFVTWCIVRDASRWVVLTYWGYGSEFYYHFYYALGLVTPLAQIFLLIEIYYHVKSRRDVSHWLVLLLFTAMMSWYSIHQRDSKNAYIVFNNIALYFQVLFCLLVHLQLQQNRRLYLGRNYSGILYGLSFMIALQSLNYGLRLFDYVSRADFATLIQTLGVIPWVAYAICMRKLDLPREIQPQLVRELASIEANFKRAAKCLR